MSQSFVEHVNYSVSNPESVAQTLCQLFGWHIRWSGEALDHGTTIHVGSDNSYLALYTHAEITTNFKRDHKILANLNHIGVVVHDLDAVEKKVKKAGLEPFSHREYEPGGRRFYFLIDDNVEIEVISYN